MARLSALLPEGGPARAILETVGDRMDILAEEIDIFVRERIEEIQIGEVRLRFRSP